MKPKKSDSDDPQGSLFQDAVEKEDRRRRHGNAARRDNQRRPKTKAITPRSIESVNVDTTVQEKAVAYPTDARLYHSMRGKLVKLAKRWGIDLRQSYRANALNNRHELYPSRL